MSDKHSRTEKPTSRQRDKFREEGQIAVSRDVISISVLLASTIGLYLGFSRGGQQLLDVTRAMLGKLEQITPAGPLVWLLPLLVAGAMLLVPPALASTVGALTSGFAQTRGLFSFKPMAPKPDRFNPLKRLKQMFFSRQAAVSLLQSTGKVSLIAALTYQYFWQQLHALAQLGDKTPFDILLHIGSVSLALALRIVPLLALFAVVDYLLTRHRLEEQMKMTKQEVKDEHRQHDGDPEVRRRQRGRAREMAQNRMLAQVRKADAVVVNPTHFAVALRYDMRMAAPHVCAKGEDEVAAAIRSTARRFQVPVIHNPPLARRLYAQVKVGQPIPARLFAAVAEVLAHVYRLRGRLPT